MRWFVGLVLNQKKIKMDRLEKLQLGIEIIEGIKHFQRSIKWAEDNIKMYKSYHFGHGVLMCRHRIEIYTMCIARLEERYTKLINQL